MMGGMAGAMGTALQAPVNTAALSRKIIYDGEIDLIVKDVDPIAKQVVTFIQDARLHRRAEHDRLSGLSALDALEAADSR